MPVSLPEPLVLIPGLMSDARLFLPQIVRLGSGRPLHIALPTTGDTVEQMSDAIQAGLPADLRCLAMVLAVMSPWI